MKNEKEEITIKSIWKTLRSDKGKKYSFFIFYIFFFIFLFIILTLPIDEKTNNSSNNQTDTQKEIETFPFSTKTQEQTNYQFQYTINYNLKTIEYLAKKQDNTIILQDDRGVYNFSYQNGKLQAANTNTIDYIRFLDFYEIKRMIKNSKLISETKNILDNNYIYTYSISTENLVNLFEENFQVTNDLENQIIIKTSTEQEIIEITLDILNYVKLTKEEINSYKIIINYGDNYE